MGKKSMSTKDNPLFGHKKENATFYTPERIARAKSYIERYDWGKKTVKRMFETGDPVNYYIGGGYISADMLTGLPDEKIWSLQPPTSIPRLICPKDGANLCPVHGEEIRKFNAFNAWRIDPINHPYQVQCPVGGEWYPSNAYGNGDMTSGQYPDDGNGYLQDGKRYLFLREYAHMAYGSFVIPSLKSLSEAYVLTGKAVYARKGCILLARLAQQYPNYGWDESDKTLEDRTARTLYGPWGCKCPPGSGTGAQNISAAGMITANCWEGGCLVRLALVYDALWNYMDKDQDQDMLAFIRSQGLPINTGAELRNYIGTYILRAGMRALMQGKMSGNEGTDQGVAMLLALVADDFSEVRPNSLDMMDFAFFGDKGAIKLVRNGLYPDGGGHESPFYNQSKFGLITMAKRMDELMCLHPEPFLRERYPDVFTDPKGKALFDHYINIQASDTIYPLIGDCWPPDNARRKVAVISAAQKNNAFAALKHKEPRYAAACFDEKGEIQNGDIWEDFPETEIRKLAARPEAKIVRESRLVDPFGAAILESGDFARRHCVALNYSNHIGHRQQDALSLELHARQLYLLQDLGYPQSWLYRWPWDANSMAHNTVTVDETQPPMFSLNAPMEPLYTRSPGTGATNEPPAMGGGGRVRMFAATDGIHVVSASHEQYQGVTLGNSNAKPVTIFERMTLLIDVNPDKAYVVDLFSVNGGEQHDQSWHAFPTDAFLAPSLPWNIQKKGTLAGPDVEPFAGYTDKWGRVYKQGHAPSFISSIRSAPLANPACFTWKTAEPEKDALDLHLLPLGNAAEVILGKGKTPIRQEQEYVFLRKKPEAGGLSRFVSVIAPYQGESFVKAAKITSQSPLKIEVELVNGEQHEITLNPAETATNSAMARPMMGVKFTAVHNGKTLRNITIGNGENNSAHAWASAKVEAIAEPDSAAPRIMIKTKSTADAAAFAPNTWVRIFSEGRSTMYRIISAQAASENHTWLTLDKTMLLSEGKVEHFSGTELQLDSRLLLARTLGNSTVEAGKFSAIVESATLKGLLRLIKQDAPAPEKGELAHIWDFSTGATIETPRIKQNS